ncbi:MAG: hypothetical protein M1823_000463 [Watsoniomyces obsoletus]|nr:MAG: hypothetical protein M1823_000463 [Watsoniomyces obsoletus]
MSTHQAYLYEGPDAPLKKTDLPTPTPTTGQVLVSVLATAISHDVPHLFKIPGFLRDAPLPLVPGIGGIGRVIAVGEPNSSSLKPGQLVFCNPVITARDDPSSTTTVISGLTAGMTPAARKIMEGEFRHGSFAEKLLLPVENAVVLDEEELLKKRGYTPSQLVYMAHPLIGYSGLRQVDLKAGETVIVAPATAHFGSAGVLAALAMGAGRVIVMGRNEEALEHLKTYDHLDRVRSVRITGDAQADGAAIRAATPFGAGADVYLDFAPTQAADSTHFGACLGSLKGAGRAVFMGGVFSEIPINYGLIMFNKLTIVGHLMYTPQHVLDFVKLVQSGVFDLNPIKIHEYAFDQMDKALEKCESYSRLPDLAVLIPTKE